MESLVQKAFFWFEEARMTSTQSSQQVEEHRYVAPRVRPRETLAEQLSRSLQFHAPECFKHFFFGRRLQNVVLRKFFRLWILRGSNAPSSVRDIVRSTPKVHARSE